MSASIIVKFGGNLDDLKKALAEGKVIIKDSSSAMERLAAQLGGAQAARDAEKWAGAIGKVGDATKLVEKDQIRANQVMARAIEYYERAGKEVPQAWREIQKATDDATKAHDRAGTSIGTMVKGYVAGLATFETAKRAIGGVVEFVKSSIDAYAKQELATKRVTAALIAQGNATPALQSYYKDLASEVQRTTIYSDDLTAEMQALLVEIGDVAPDQMKGALQAATDLASGLGIDLRTAVTLVGKAFAGETGTLTRYGIVIDQAKLKSEGANAVLGAIQEKFGGQAAAEVDTYSGKVAQLANDWDDLKEAVGGAAAKLLEASGIISNLGALTRGATTVAEQGGFWKGVAAYLQTALSQGGNFGLAGVELLSGITAAGYAGAQSLPGAPFPLPVTPAKPSKAEQAAIDAEARKLTALREELYGTAAVRKVEDYIKAIGGIERVSRLSATGQDILRRAIENAMLATGRATPTMRGYAAALPLASTALPVSQLTTAPASVTGFAASELPLPSTALPGLGFAFAAPTVTGAMPEPEAFWTDLFGDAGLFGKQAGLRYVEGIGQAMAGAVQGGGNVAGATALASIAGFGQLFSQPKAGGTANYAGALIQAALLGGGVGYATRSKILGASTGALGGALTGASAASSLGVTAGWGTAIGAGVGAISGLVGASIASRKARRAAEIEADTRIAQLQDELIRSYGTLDEIRGMANGLGDALAGAWGDKSIAGLKHFSALARDFTDELARMADVEDQITATEAELADLRDRQVPTWRELEDLANQYGIDVKTLGANFGQLKTTDVTQAILSDFERLKTGGVDVNTILVGMQEEISQLVQDSLQFGSAIPENMRPLITQLAEAGRLTDENGEKFTDLTKLKWAEPVKTDAEILTTAIGELVTKLGELIDSLHRVPTSLANPFQNWTVWEPPDMSSPAPPEGFQGGQYWGGTYYPVGHRGGVASRWPQPIIVAHGGLAPDEFPAILQSGEAVLSRVGLSAVGAAAVRSWNRGEAVPVDAWGSRAPVATPTVNLYHIQAWDGADVDRVLQRQGMRSVTTAIKTNAYHNNAELRAALKALLDLT